nr:MAG TPA: hypothetical protein [Caudoviricetes sp.]
MRANLPLANFPYTNLHFLLKLHYEFLFTIFDFWPGMAYNNGAEIIRKR